MDTNDYKLKEAYSSGFSDGNHEGFLEGKDVGWAEGFKEESRAHAHYIGSYQDELDITYENFGNIFRDIIVKFHGKKNDNVVKLLQYLDCYSPTAREHLNVESLFNHMK